MHGRMRLCVCVLVAAGGLAWAGEDPLKSWQGDWQGTWKTADGAERPLVAQLIALGGGKAQANLLEAFDTREPALCVLHGTLTDGTLRLAGEAKEGKLAGTRCTATVAEEGFRGTFEGETTGSFALKHVVRRSPTLGAEPPEGAVVLFDGTSLDAWVRKGGRPCRWKLLKEEKAMEVRGGGIISRRAFRDHKVHLEFRTPYQPAQRGQKRGNSGAYLQGRYEVQVLDSYGLEGRHNECGGIYSVAAPRVNMCAPPLQWQTYDTTFHAPRFDAQGKKTRSARLTVLHNGVVVHREVDVPHPTTACWDRNVREPGGLHLQDHGNPVRYRNVWVVEIEPAGETK